MTYPFNGPEQAQSLLGGWPDGAIVQEFRGQVTVSGGTQWYTWYKPRGKSYLGIVCIGSGGPGGGGPVTPQVRRKAAAVAVAVGEYQQLSFALVLSPTSYSCMFQRLKLEALGERAVTGAWGR